MKCCSSEGCCSSSQDVRSYSRTVNVDFLYLDLSQCGWCQETDSNLDNAVAKLSEVFKATGVVLKLNKIQVASEEQAEELGFATSPTIRVNGKDIQLDYKEAYCTSCSDLCAADVECRVWLYQGNEYTSPPEGLLMEAILREVYGSSNSCCSNQSKPVVPQNLKKFFRGIGLKGKDRSVQLARQPR